MFSIGKQVYCYDYEFAINRDRLLNFYRIETKRNAITKKFVLKTKDLFGYSLTQHDNYVVLKDITDIRLIFNGKMIKMHVPSDDFRISNFVYEANKYLV